MSDELLFVLANAAVVIAGTLFLILRYARALALPASLGFVKEGGAWRGASSGVYLEIRVAGLDVIVSAPAPERVQMVARPRTSAAAEPSLVTGDPAFDGAVRAFGPAETLRPALDAGTRALVRRMLGHWRGEVRGGRVRACCRRITVSRATLRDAIDDVATLSLALAEVGTGEPPSIARITALLASDAPPRVRREALALLARHRPGLPTQLAARDRLIADRDPVLCVEAALLAGPEGRAWLFGGRGRELDAAVDAEVPDLERRLAAALSEEDLLRLLTRTERPGRDAIAGALALVGSVHAVEALLARGHLREAQAIQARLGDVDAGRVSLAARDTGQLSIAPEPGAVSVVSPGPAALDSVAPRPAGPGAPGPAPYERSRRS